MEPFRLKLKIGPHEFEAEGDQESVERQFAVWRELIASPSASPPTGASPPPTLASQAGTPPPPAAPVTPLPGEADERSLLSRIFRHDGRVVALTVPPPAGPNQRADAMLALLLGQKVFNGEDSVTGQQISDGMRMSGLPVDRVDRSWGPYADTMVMRTGVNRGIRYRLNIPGYARAREIAQQLLEQVP